jgi:hypothetical protein
MANQERLYRIWANMKTRVTNPNYAQKDYYSVRGITLCDRWQSYQNFKEDMGKTYRDGLSIDRIDNDRGYSPSNCRWATPKEQANNTRRNRKITIDGITRNLSQWIDNSGVKSSTVRQRYYVYGWDIKRSLGMVG